MYQLNTTGITRLADLANIPYDKDNRDYQAYLAWLAGGNVPLPMATPPAAEPAVNPLATKLDRVIELLETMVSQTGE